MGLLKQFMLCADEEEEAEEKGRREQKQMVVGPKAALMLRVSRGRCVGKSCDTFFRLLLSVPVAVLLQSAETNSQVMSSA